MVSVSGSWLCEVSVVMTISKVSEEFWCNTIPSWFFYIQFACVKCARGQIYLENSIKQICIWALLNHTVWNDGLWLLQNNTPSRANMSAALSLANSKILVEDCTLWYSESLWLCVLCLQYIWTLSFSVVLLLQFCKIYFWRRMSSVCAVCLMFVLALDLNCYTFCTSNK